MKYLGNFEKEEKYFENCIILGWIGSGIIFLVVGVNIALAIKLFYIYMVSIRKKKRIAREKLDY